MGAPSYEQALAAITTRLGDGALAHCVRVADTAEGLATVYGVDAGLARLAGLLHDWDRDLDDAALRAAADEGGLAVTDADRSRPYLLHGRTAALTLSDELPGLPDEVLRAVELHTFGAERMSELDMVVYLADMLEPSRSFEGVDDLREAVGELSLEDLFVKAYQLSVLHLVRGRKPIHPQTVAVWNSVVAQVRR